MAMETLLWMEVLFGKSLINGPFPIAMFDYQRVYHMKSLFCIIYNYIIYWLYTIYSGHIPIYNQYVTNTNVSSHFLGTRLPSSWPAAAAPRPRSRRSATAAGCHWRWTASDHWWPQVLVVSLATNNFEFIGDVWEFGNIKMRIHRDMFRI